MILRPLKQHCMKRTITLIMFVMMMLKCVNGKPQDAGFFEKVASQVIAVGGNMAETVGNAGMMSKNMGFDMPFAKANSETKAGTGAALRNNDDDDDSSEEDRRKRSVENSLMGEETLLALSPKHQFHFHRDKRSPCHTSGGTGGGSIPSNGDDIDVERRLRAYARKAKAAAKKAKSRKTTTKKKLVNDNEEDSPTVTRRKRQSEVDDLNQTMQNTSNGFAQHAQQIAEKIRSALDNFMTSMSDMVQKLQNHFSDPNSSNNAEI